MFIKPKSGLRIRDPQMQDYLPEEGREVNKSMYWFKRLKDGDVIETKPIKTKEKEK